MSVGISPKSGRPCLQSAVAAKDQGWVGGVRGGGRIEIVVIRGLRFAGPTGVSQAHIQESPQVGSFRISM